MKQGCNCMPVIYEKSVSTSLCRKKHKKYVRRKVLLYEDTTFGQKNTTKHNYCQIQKYVPILDIIIGFINIMNSNEAFLFMFGNIIFKRGAVY